MKPSTTIAAAPPLTNLTADSNEHIKHHSVIDPNIFKTSASGGTADGSSFIVGLAKHKAK
jgi:hypothetical protein